MRIEIGTFVTWSSAAGQLLGEVTQIRLDLNAAKTIVPWVTIRHLDTDTLITLCGTSENLEMMKVKVVEMEEEYELVNSDDEVIGSYTVRI